MTDRIILYPGSVPLETDTMFAETGAMVGLGYLAQMVLGTGAVADGLACTPTAPASLTVNVGPGSIATLATVDATAMSSQAANSAPLVKLGINLTSTAFTFAAPGTAGQSINYLIEAQMLESDGDPLVLSYYNATNPALPYVGPANSGSAQNTQRTQRVSLQVKNGTAANAGTQTTPGVDAGWSGLWIVTVNYGQTQITSSSIAVYPTAPFLPFKLGTIPTAGRFLSRRDIGTAGAATINFQANTNSAFVTIIGAGGGGGGCSATSSGQSAAGSGGGGGASTKLFLAAPSGKTLANLLGYVSAQVGAPGAGGAAGFNNGSPGGATYFYVGGLTYVANGGGAGFAGNAGTGPYAVGAGLGGVLTSYTAQTIDSVTILAYPPYTGGSGGFGIVYGAGNCTSGQGGSSAAGAPGAFASNAGGAGTISMNFGAGGSGACQIQSAAALAGGTGAPGLVIVEEYSE